MNALFLTVFTSQTDFFKWCLENPKNDQVMNVSSDEFTSNLSYPCKSSSDCTFYSTTLPKGYYKVEVWGARGGRARYHGEQTQFFNGGYSVGVLNLTQDYHVFVYIGGSGTDAPSPSTCELRGGFNGGGSVPIDDVDGQGGTIGDDQGGSGGGSTDIRVGRNDIESRVIVAGGAGGSGHLIVTLYDDDKKAAGFGGGLTAGIPINVSSRYQAAGQTSGATNFYGQNGIKDKFSPSGGGGGGYFGGLAGEAGAVAGGGSGYIGGVISTSDITKQSIGGNQIIPLPEGTTGIGNPGHGAARITRMRYSIRNTTEIKERYIANSEITIGLEISSIGPGEKSTIFRYFNNEESLIDEHNDNGQIHTYNDIFTLPQEPNKYSLKYRVVTKDNLEKTIQYEINVGISPTIKNTTSFKDKYRSNYRASCEFEIVCYAESKLILEDESGNKLVEEDVTNSPNPTKYSISYIIPYTEGNSTRKFVAYVIDAHELKSRNIEFTYNYLDIQPEFNLNRFVNYAVKRHDSLEIYGDLRDREYNGLVYFNTSLDEAIPQQSYKLNIINDSWIPFKFSYPTKNVDGGVHNLKLIVYDILGAKTEKIHKFTLITNPYKMLNIPRCSLSPSERSMMFYTLSYSSLFSK